MTSSSRHLAPKDDMIADHRARYESYLKQEAEPTPPVRYLAHQSLGGGLGAVGERWTGHGWVYCMNRDCPARAENRRKKAAEKEA